MVFITVITIVILFKPVFLYIIPFRQYSKTKYNPDSKSIILFFIENSNTTESAKQRKSTELVFGRTTIPLLLVDDCIG